MCHSWRIWAPLYSEKITLKITSLEAPTEKNTERKLWDYGSSPLKCLEASSCLSPSPGLQDGDGDGVGDLENRKDRQ